jgi:hypothetical protein
MQGADTCVQLGEGLGLGEVVFTAGDGDGDGAGDGEVGTASAARQDVNTVGQQTQCTPGGREHAGVSGVRMQQMRQDADTCQANASCGAEA